LFSSVPRQGKNLILNQTRATGSEVRRSTRPVSRSQGSTHFGRSSSWRDLCIFPAVKRQSCAAGPPAASPGSKDRRRGLANLLMRKKAIAVASVPHCYCLCSITPTRHSHLWENRPLDFAHQEALVFEPISARITQRALPYLRSTTNCTTRSPHRVPGHLFKPITLRTLACDCLRHAFSCIV